MDLLRGVEGPEGVRALSASSPKGLLELHLRQSLRVVQRHCEHVTHALFQELFAVVGISGLFSFVPGSAGDPGDVESLPLELREMRGNPLFGFGVGDRARPKPIGISNACR